MRRIIDAHYEHRMSKRQHARLNEEYYFIMKALSDAPWWKRLFVWREMVRRIRSGKIL